MNVLMEKWALKVPWIKETLRILWKIKFCRFFEKADIRKDSEMEDTEGDYTDT